MLALTLYHWIVLGVLLLILGNVLANVATFDGLRPSPPPPDAPRVSIMVPARNEALNIEACVSSLLAQDYPNFELLVMDDQSSDGTGDIVDRLIAGAPHVKARLLRGTTLPAGWAGKNWACHQLAQLADGSYLFFTDADTVHAPGTVTAAVAYAQRNRASLVSAWPRLLTGTLGEKLIVPMIFVVGVGFCPLWLQRRLQERRAKLNARQARALGAANGQFLFFSREGYDAVGGHASLSDHVVEDVALGRAVAARMGDGLRLFNCESLQFSTVRMYRSFAESWAGFTKNMRAVFEDQWAGFWFFGFLQWTCLFAPFLWLCWPEGPAWPVVLAQVGVIVFIRILLALRYRTSWVGVLLHPLGMLLIMGIAFNSWRLSRGRGVEWKGRIYRPKI